MTIVILSSLILIFQVRSSKPNLFAMLPSSARPLKSSLLLNAFPESIIFRLQPTELLIFYCVTIRSRQIQLQMPCLVSFQKKPLGPHITQALLLCFQASRIRVSLFELHFFQASLLRFRASRFGCSLLRF